MNMRSDTVLSVGGVSISGVSAAFLHVPSQDYTAPLHTSSAPRCTNPYHFILFHCLSFVLSFPSEYTGAKGGKTMRLFRSFRCRVIVPVDSTISEPFVLRCLHNALDSVPTRITGALLFSSHPWGDPEHLTYAIRSLASAHQCQPLLLSRAGARSHAHACCSATPHPVDGGDCTFKHHQLQTSDMLLDTVVPILASKCNLDDLEDALVQCGVSHADYAEACGNGEEYGEDSFSLCTMLAATRAAKGVLEQNGAI
jgi:hypothetical protein